MTQADLFRWLLESTCASSAAIVLVLLLRRPLRATFGANAAYLLWLLPPLAVLAASLPAPVVHVPRTDAAAGMGAVAFAIVDSASTAGRALASWLLVAWCAGVVASALSQAAVQRRFHRSLVSLPVDANRLLPPGTSHARPAAVCLLPRPCFLPAFYVH